jgi:hypothetical protein
MAAIENLPTGGAFEPLPEDGKRDELIDEELHEMASIVN